MEIGDGDRWKTLQVTTPKNKTISDETNANGEVILEVGPGVTSATIDAEYLSPGSDYAAKLISLERSGNQTIAAFEFKTSG